MNQEEIVDNIILDMLEIKYPGIKKKVLTDTKKSKRRSGMLAFLGDDKELFSGYKNIVDNNPQRPCAQYSKDILNMLREYVKIVDVEVKRFGEVMTPFTLVDDMLNTLPDDVWLNPNLKWLDPCNGIGTFPCIIVDRLMVGLKDVIPNDCDRYKHIIENMIYVCELQVKNMFLYHCAFDREDNYALNTYCGSFLDEKFDEHMKNVWGVDKFDIVVANPPYQTQREGDRKTHSLWDKFVEKSISLLSYGGYLNMVHPSGWRNVDGGFKKVQKVMLSKTFLYLSINSSQEGKKTFGATTSFDYYCLINKSNINNVKTKIKCIDGSFEEYCLNNVEFIPNGMFSYIFSLVANDYEEKVNVLHSYSAYETRKPYIKKNKDDEFKYPCVYSIKKGCMPTFKYSSCADKGHFNIKKMIFGNGANPTYMRDEKGIYGLTQFSFAVYDYDLDIIEKAINTDEVKKITQMTKFVSTAGNPILYPKILSLFRKDFWKQILTK